MSRARSGVVATSPRKTGTPCAAKRSLAWYSNRSTRCRLPLFSPLRCEATQHNAARPTRVVSTRNGDDERMTDARQWIGALGGRLSVQAALLESLLSAAEDDDRWEWLELSCSVANGRGDELSDLDVGLGHRGGVAPPTDEVTQLVSGFGDVVEVSVQPWDCFTRWWVQYADGGQLDLVVMPAAHRPGRAPNSVALLDRSGVLAEEFTPKAWAATPEEPGYWLLDGWEALSNVAKYVRRGHLPARATTAAARGGTRHSCDPATCRSPRAT